MVTYRDYHLRTCFVYKLAYTKSINIVIYWLFYVYVYYSVCMSVVICLITYVHTFSQ